MLDIEFPIQPRSGRDLKRVFDFYNPFNSNTTLKQQTDRVTIIGANSNHPNEIQTDGIMRAAAESESLIIVQYSLNSCLDTGVGGKNMKLKIPRLTQIRPTAIGAAQNRFFMAKYASLYGVDFAFMSLDHFTAPNLEKVDLEHKIGSSDWNIARARIEDAANVLASVGEWNIKNEFKDQYASYMVSPEYQSYRKDFLAAVEFGKPALAMIDTGNLPIVLNFATTREIIEAVRRDLNNPDVMIEAEISATGQGGDDKPYTYWGHLTREERVEERALTGTFVEYTGAEAIAYIIGMKHAAKAGESHEPDEAKLLNIQQHLCFSNPGRYIPFVQHGGTGSSRIINGVVAKYNVNTQLLGEMAKIEKAWAEQNRDGIVNRDKKAIGNGRFFDMADAVRGSMVKYFDDSNSTGRSHELREKFGERGPNLSNVYNGTQAEGKE